MRVRLIAALITALGLFARPLHADDARRGTVRVVVDTSEVPELASWGESARRLIVKWHPIIAELLKSDGFTPATEVKVVFSRERKGVAGTAGNTITISANHVKQHPEDFGMVVHELTHVLQRYPHAPNTGWLVEGIADYVRFYRYEPKTPLPRIDPSRASYRDGYKTAARFLAWIERRHRKTIVVDLNAILRKGAYEPEVFKELTGKDLDQLWAEFRQSLKRR
jgi:hypothetical protein